MQVPQFKEARAEKRILTFVRNHLKRNAFFKPFNLTEVGLQCDF